MRILWITNILFPAPSEALRMPVSVYGGWMVSLLRALRRSFLDLEFAIATTYPGKEFKNLKIDEVTYYLLPSSKPMSCYNKDLEPLWQVVKDEFKPDVIHIHGTEYAHGLAYIRACGVDRVCVSIQGLVSVYSRYYYAGISMSEILKNITLRDILKFDTIFHKKRKFEKSGEFEKEYIKSVSHIIGRTSWDRSHIWALNPQAIYHFCNETLRPSFYKYNWEYDKCEKHSIFISQAGYPIKGLHKVLEAMPLILRHYPNTRIKIAGQSVIDQPFYRLTGYGKYIKSIIKRLNLQEKVEFLGVLSETEMCAEYLKANLFICPSSIENSPNSLGEAQLIGVPYIASYVGGTPDLMSRSQYALYRFEEVEMLALKVCEIFNNAKSVLQNDMPFERHSISNNAATMYDIYLDVINSIKEEL